MQKIDFFVALPKDSWGINGILFPLSLACIVISLPLCLNITTLLGYCSVADMKVNHRAPNKTSACYKGDTPKSSWSINPWA